MCVLLYIINYEREIHLCVNIHHRLNTHSDVLSCTLNYEIYIKHTWEWGNHEERPWYVYSMHYELRERERERERAREREKEK